MTKGPRPCIGRRGTPRTCKALKLLHAGWVLVHPCGVHKDGQRRAVAPVRGLKGSHQRLIHATPSVEAHVHCELQAQHGQHPHCNEACTGALWLHTVGACVRVRAHVLSPGMCAPLVSIERR